MNATTPQAPVGLKEAAPAADTLKEKKLRKACNEFEALLVKQMIDAMRSSVPKSGLIDGGYAEQMYQSMYDDELAKEMSAGKGMGIGDILYKQLSGQSRSTISK